MRTVDRIRMKAPAERVFRAAVDVEQWPSVLSHYRWVRVLERSGDRATVRWPRGVRSGRSGIPPGGCRKCG